MELIDQKISSRKLNFKANGTDYFIVKLVNAILMGLTLGIYYPWAKAKKLIFLYENTELDNVKFRFTGTGNEMFIGFIKAVGIFLVFYIALITAVVSHNQSAIITVTAVFYIAILLLVPIGIHGSLRYRLSRSFWGNIQFSYIGDRSTLIKEFLLGMLLTALTLGIYGSWFVMKLRTYITNHIRFGNASFTFNGQGKDYFILNLKGLILTVLTLGIYYFWFYKDLIKYLADNTKLEQEGREISFNSEIEGIDFLVLSLTNLLIIVFTLGIGLAWVEVRTIKFLFERMEIQGEFNPLALVSIDDDFKDATGDDIADMLDINLI
jgi:uncharacterized membrane protein YjgN (DUF898 family)